MAKFAFVLGALALCTAAAGKKSQKLRATCVDANGQLRPEGDKWYEGVNGCLELTCVNGSTVGVDSCTCVYPDGTIGNSGDSWYSIPTCQTCQCGQGTIQCEKLLNCITPTTAAPMPSGTVTLTQTIGASAPILTATCPGPDGLTLNIGDMYIEGCQNCTCTISGLLCSGMVECPIPMPTAPGGGQCFTGFLGFVDSDLSTAYVPHGYVLVDNCNTCTCNNGAFTCVYSCSSMVLTSDAVPVVTVTVSPPPTVTVGPTIEAPDFTDDSSAALDCDVGDGIVLNGEPYSNECGAECLCVDGAIECGECPNVGPTGPSPFVCVDLQGNSVPNGGSYMSEKCTNCTCVDGTFTCMQTCERDCMNGSKVVKHGKTSTSTCSKCKCNDSYLTCENTCADQVCTIPGSKTTIKRNESKNIDECNWCKCSDTALLTCRNKCVEDTSCVCDGRMLKDGKSTSTSKCESCKCDNGTLKCKKTC